MEIIVNGEAREVEQGSCVKDHLKTLDLNLDTVVVECDGVILKREEYASCLLKEGSVLEVIRFIGGG